jgi:restriction system protein
MGGRGAGTAVEALMSIWVYAGVSGQPHYVWSGTECTFCRSSMTLLHQQLDDISTIKSEGSYEKRLFVCAACGWWKADGRQDVDDFVHRLQFQSIYGAAASLGELDLSDIAAPIAEVRSYLAARYEERFTMHPRLFEETVASVFGDLGYDAEATAYSGDGGIDVILRRGKERIGVQVKRYRQRIEAEQIRSLAGALLLDGVTRGIFVTTSTFRRGAEGATAKLATRGYQIELMDAERFFDALKIAQREMYGSFADFPLQDCLRHLTKVSDEVLSDRYTRVPFSDRF